MKTEGMKIESVKTTDITKPCNRNSFWGVALVAGGLYLLLQKLGLAGGFAGGLAGSVLSLFWSMAFAVGAFFWLSLFATAPTNRWWAAIPGFVLAGLASVTLIDQFIPMAEPITGPLFLGSIGAGFVVVFLFNQHQWWAIIPAGVLTSLAIVAGIDEMPVLARMIGIDTGAIFLMGLSLTFLAVATLPAFLANGKTSGNANGKISRNASRNANEKTLSLQMNWAFIPAAVLMVIALTSEANFGTNFGDVAGNMWPLFLIIGGGALLWRRFGGGQFKVY